MFQRTLYCLTILALLFFPLTTNRIEVGRVEIPLLIEKKSEIGLALSRSDWSGVELELSVPTYQILRGTEGEVYGHKISLEGVGQTTEIGKPEMPVYSAILGLPAGAQVSLKVISDVSETVPGYYNILPVPRADFLQEDATSGQLVYERDDVAYARNAFYPDIPVRIVDDAWLRDLRVVRIEIYPFQYNPIMGTLLLHRYMRVEVQFKESPPTQMTVDIGTESDAYHAVLRGLVMNYDVARAWRGIPASEIYHPDIPGQSSPADIYEPVFLGPRYKVVVDHDGLYRLSYEELQQAQPLFSHDPNTFHLYNQGRDVAIYIDDGADGYFGVGDSIYFFGEKFRGDYLAQRYAEENTQWITLTEQLSDGSIVPWHPEFNHFMLEKYTAQNVYWLTVGGTGGPRMAEVNGDPTGSIAPIPATYQATVRAEQELRHWEQSFTTEDTWYWEWVADLNTHVYTTTLSGIAIGAYTATVRGEVASYSYNADHSPDHHTRFLLNNRVDPIDDSYWDGKSRYRFEEQIPQTDLLEGINQLKFQNINDAFTYPMIMFDFFEVEFTRLFVADQNRLLFPGESAGTWRYSVGGFTTNLLAVYDVTNPVLPVHIVDPVVNFADGSYLVTFLATQNAGERYYVTGGYESPDSLTYYQPPDFATLYEGADYIFITHPDFLSGTQNLANYRANQGISTMVVNVEDLYAEFNDGIFHPLAIKNFIAYTFSHWVTKPTYVLLIGDGSWHMKNSNPARYGSAPTYMPPNLSWVDPWLGQTDSPNLLATVVGSDILPDVLIGRLPVSSSSELSDIVSKITSYEQSPIQSWQRNLLFIADDTPDQAGDFVLQSEMIIHEFIRPGFTPIRIYLDDYKDNNRCGTQPFPFGPTCMPVNRAITETVSTTGTLFVNYTGHAATQYWTSDKILLYQVENPSIPDDFSINDIASMDNGEKLPVVLSMTCWDGVWFYPIAVAAQPSLTEIWLRTAGRGAVAVFSATGLGVESGHVTLQEGFYGAIFKDGVWNLGLASLAGKLNLYRNGGNYDLINTYVTFGDPALHFPSPYQTGLTPHAREGSALPGGSVTYSFQATNQGTITDTIGISVTNNLWPVTYPISIGPLPAGQSQSFNVTVNIPASVEGGLTDSVTLNLFSLGDRSKADSAILVTHSQSTYGVQVSPPSSSQFNLPGSPVEYNLQVTNLGNRADSYVISLGPHNWPVETPTLIGPVGRGQTVTLPVTVNIPSGAEDRDDDSVTVHITSQAAPGETASSVLFTVARTYGVAFIPPSSSIEAPQGTTVTYTLQVENVGGYLDSYTITVESQWVAAVEPNIVGPISPEHTSAINISVDIPTDLPGGTYDEAILTATSWGDPTRTKQAVLRTIGDAYGLLVRPAYYAQDALPGSTVTYTLQITNTSNQSDTYDVFMGIHNWPATLSATTIGPLTGNGGSASLLVNVDIPKAVPDWSSETFVITVSSQTIPERIAIATLDTTARLYGVTVKPSVFAQDGFPNRDVVYPLTVQNTGGYRDTFTVAAAGNWPIDIYPPLLGPLDVGETARIYATVHIPSGAGNDSQTTMLTVTSWGDPETNAQATLVTTSKLYGVVLNTNIFYASGQPGEEVIFEILVTNTSEYEDTFTAQITSDWLASVDPVWIGPLPPHDFTTMRVAVNIPIDAVNGNNSIATIVVTSWTDNTQRAAAKAITYVGWIPLNLPLIQK